GKTTTLRMISGLEVPTEGEIYFDAANVADLPVQRRNVGMVFQRYALFPHMTVERNVSFGLRVRGTPKAEVDRRVDEILGVVQLEELRHRFPSQLSGGQMQRVAIARTLVTNPSVLMMDEPLANLDTKLRGEMRVFIRGLQQRLGITTIFVTHDQVEAMELADRIAVMFAGKIAQYDTPLNIFHRPASLDVARFIGAPNLFEARALSRNGEATIETPYGTLPVADLNGHADGERVDAMIRPEAVVLTVAGEASQGNLDGRIVSADFFGQATTYMVDLNGATIRADEMSNRQLGVGQPVTVRLRPEKIWIFPASRGAAGVN
ncbi:MAG: ABC transporter ATP-binding protein, partial [Devosia sp.]|nr:ABC transporter ATP-binding protein [Devosia sp.]